ncbi:uncharacterized protein LOC119098261 [Pollicipes pollicipes]|uniref:uncharacterized protein LOC119098261 n=1 Tax=Pollicipes pollicipes TaxID=41117 RepID=UPI00188569B5|nr:uncharacterized protein LOC119098261 [Pollicipes pollicipes]
MTEEEVEVAAYATLSSTGRGSKNKKPVPAVILESNTCPLHCGEPIKSENHLRGHLKVKHSIEMQKELKHFENMGSFLAWKEAREREASRRYVVRETRSDWRRFACSRSGQPSGTNRPQRWKKTGKFCPAYIRTKTATDGSVTARFSLLHTCQQPDLTPLSSDREVARAHWQLDLFERALSDSQPRQRKRRRTSDVEAEPEPQPDPQPEPEMELEPEPEPEPEPDAALEQDGQLHTPAMTESPRAAVRRPHWTARGARASKVRLKLATARSRRNARAARLSESGSGSGGGGGLSATKQLVRTNLVRLLGRLELASEAEADLLLRDTSALLERHARIRRRGNAGTRLRRHQTQATASVDPDSDHPYAGGRQAAVASLRPAPAEEAAPHHIAAETAPDGRLLAESWGEVVVVGTAENEADCRVVLGSPASLEPS